MIREEIILSHIRGKDVLDIGSVGQDMEFGTDRLIEKASGEETQKYYLWGRMKEAARSLTGIDMEPAAVEGVVQGDMETHSFGRQFDAIVAGDIIEHVDNPGLFLDNVRKHLKDGGKFIVTTPNAKWFTVILKPNPTHTHWHDKYTLFEILKRHRFRVDHFQYYYGNKPYYNWIKRVLVLRQGLLAVCSKA